MLWPFGSSSSVSPRKNSDHDLTELDVDMKPRKESEGESTACEDWSDMDEDEGSRDELIMAPSDDISLSSSIGDDDTPSHKRMSRFSIFHRSGPIFRGSQADVTYNQNHVEQVPQVQGTGTLRHIVRVTENVLDESGIESNLLASPHHEKAHTKATSTVGNPYQVVKGKDSATLNARGNLDFSLFCVYSCCCVVLALPVMLLPLVASDITSELKDGSSAAGFVASVASVTTLGAGVGKIINGFVCKWLGGRQSSFLYLLGMASCSIFLSITSNHVGLAMAGIEFFSSIQFTSMALLLTNHYDCDVTKLAAGMTTVSYGSTFGMLFANFLGTGLLQRYHWRSVAQFGAFVALVGAMIIQFRVKEFPLQSHNGKAATSATPIKDNERLTLRGVMSSVRHVLGSRLFWQVGIAHAMSFLVRTSDRVLGTFFQETTLLPHNVIGGLLASLALGYFYGLLSGNKITRAKTAVAKSRLLTKRYSYAVFSTLVLAVCANGRVKSALQQYSNMLLILVVTLSAGSMASFLSFQIYLLPSMVASTFGKNKPVCLSFLDGLGYFLASPIWATTSHIVSHPRVEPHGWSIAWTLLALFFATGGILMMRALPPVLHKQTGESTPSNSKDQQRDSEIVHQA